MKKNIKLFYTVLLLVLFSFISCDKGFDKMNINPVGLNFVDPVLQLNRAIINTAHTYTNLQYEVIIVKQMINPYTGVGAAAQFNQDRRNLTASNWTRLYRNTIRELVDVINTVKDDPDKTNLYNMARIWQAYAFMILTDSYGDVPYSEAALGFLDAIISPKYDSQESIYTDILNELETASASLDASKPAFTGDVLYGGDIYKWRRLGNSLLLRAAMRLSKVNTSLATKYVTSAVAGGLMTSISDNAIIYHDANNTYDIGAQLNGGQSAFLFMCSDFISYLKDSNDPRLTSIAVRYVGALSGTEQVESRADRTAAVQIGMPQGYDNVTIVTAVAADGLASMNDYSQLDRTRMASSLSPTFFITYSQTQLLLAEAVVRGWTTGDAKVFYENGIRAHMQQLASYGSNCAIADADIDAYILAHPYDAAKDMEEINTQYWIASFLNGPEAFANFRRSGYPDLTPNPYPGSDLKTEDFIRRLTYPDGEINVNNKNYMEAVNRQGADILDTRVWWDVK